MKGIKTAAVALGAAAVTLGMAGCTHSSSPAKTTTSHPASATPTIVPATQGPTEAAKDLPVNCDRVATDADIQAALGGPLQGTTIYLKDVAEPSIHRTGRIDCKYGVTLDKTGKPGPAGIEIQVATYDATANAVDRVAGTVAGQVAKGDPSKSVVVANRQATVMTDQGTTELFMADGNRTFVIQIAGSVAQGNAGYTVATKLGATVYQRTLPAGAGTPSASASGSPSASASGSASPSASHSASPTH